MSLITDFNFAAFQCDLNRRVAQEKSAVSLSVLTAAEMERIGFVEIRTRCGFEVKSTPWRPVVGPTGVAEATFWDTRMGNWDVKGFPTQPCSTCASQQSVAGSSTADVGRTRGNMRCFGHFGYISMPRRGPNSWLVVYNPLLFTDLMLLLGAQCYFCKKFRASQWDVERWLCALELMDEGFVGEGLTLLDRFKKGNAGAAAAVSAHSTLHPSAEEDGDEDGDDTTHAGAVPVRDISALRAEVRRVLAGHTPLSDAARAAVRLTQLDIRGRKCGEALKELKAAPHKCANCGALNPQLRTKHGHVYLKFSKQVSEHNRAAGLLSAAQIAAWDEEKLIFSRELVTYHADDALASLQRLCHLHTDALSRFFPSMGSSTVAVQYMNSLPPSQLFKAFFIDRILVPPLPLRLANGIQIQPNSGAISPDARTRELSEILAHVKEVEAYFALVTRAPATVTATQHRANEQNTRALQQKVNELYLGVLDTFAKKEGLFRMHMMGKRVNQACRSVISPDVSLEPNEVVLPRPFAKNLSFPEAVTFHSPQRVAFLRACVLNGPRCYPGATHIELRSANGHTTAVELSGTASHRQEMCDRYFSLARNGNTVVVHRHVVDGDRLIFNRQPTLHRPSMLGFRARVLSGERTIRFHYVNAKSFNADFDGDEMNIHVPQSLECRSEVELLMDANLNLVVPTSGKPIRGLIQDHLSAGVLLTLQDKFFTFAEFSQLVFVGLQPYIHLIPNFLALLPPPAVFKPARLWTGKQVVSAIVRWLSGYGAPFITSDGATGTAATESNGGFVGLSLRGRAAVPNTAWIPRNSGSSDGGGASIKWTPLPDEHTVVFLASELLVGVLDKNQLGPSHLSVAHILHEVYGPHQAGKFFAAVGRVLTAFLRKQGFSMCADDMVIMDEAGRRKLLGELDVCAFGAASEADAVAAIQKRSNAFISEFIPSKLLLPFPQNQLTLMTLSGAKGSNVNAQQMALTLGQQMFDGRRVRRMASGKTMPGFFVGDERARSFGYAMGRFASGIRPQEYTIHAAAGRDGLIDTGVKTARSGELQRYLIKGLENLVVAWDGTVRDADGSVVQFRYGGDGLDPAAASTIGEWEVAHDNAEELQRRFPTARAARAAKRAVAAAAAAACAASGGGRGGRFGGGGAAGGESDGEGSDAADSNAGSPLPARLAQGIESVVYREPLPLRTVARAARKSGGDSAVLAAALAERRSQRQTEARAIVTDVTRERLARATVAAGEPVGILAAQAAGEPSTQMTLNTFHQAGQTASHVTEGIPRLRELLVHASVSKPAVVVPVKRAGPKELDAIRRILAVVTPVGLRAALAPTVVGAAGATSAAAAPYNWSVVRRGAAGTDLHLALLLSEPRLEAIRAQMELPRLKFGRAYFAALREFAKQLARALKGVVKTRGEGGGGGGAGAAGGETALAVEDPALMEGAAYKEGGDDDAGNGERPAAGRSRRARDGGIGGDSDGDDDGAAAAAGEAGGSENGHEDDDDDDDDATVAARDRKAAALKRQRRREEKKKKKQKTADKSKSHGGAVPSSNKPESESGSDSDDSDAASGSDSAESAQSGNATTRATKKSLRAGHGGKTAGIGGKATNNDDAATDSDDEEAAASAAAAAAATSAGLSYRTFAPQTHSFLKRTVSVTARPAAVLGVNATHPDLFCVHYEVNMPADAVAVVPDAIRTALDAVFFSSPVSQVDNASWQPDTKGGGQLVFQGKGSEFRKVLNTVAVYTLDAPGIDLARASSTDYQDVGRTLGVEACYHGLQRELQKLFSRYSVDDHHLTLIADAATHRGKWDRFNFTGVISHAPAPIFQMTVASSKNFLHKTITRGVPDNLSSVSSAIVVGERPRVGTATVSLRIDAAALPDVFERTPGGRG